MAEQVRAQDVTVDAAGQPVLRQGVAKDRRISVADADMRHGRKSASRLIDGYKRHVMHDLDSALVRAGRLDLGECAGSQCDGCDYG